MLIEGFDQRWNVPELTANSGYESGRHLDLIIDDLTSLAKSYGGLLYIVEGNETQFPLRVIETNRSVLNWFGYVVFQVEQITTKLVVIVDADTRTRLFVEQRQTNRIFGVIEDTSVMKQYVD